MSKIILNVNDDLQLVRENKLIDVFDTLSPYVFNGHDSVEIGGVQWATMNIGATSVTDTGLYFQWGDTQGYTASQIGSGSGQKYFDRSDYKFYSGGYTKYNSTDGKTVLDIEDDAARKYWKGKWRLPTVEEFQALENATSVSTTSNYQGSGVAGKIFTDKTDSSKVLFFPYSKIAAQGEIEEGDDGHYWINSKPSTLKNAYTFQVLPNSVNVPLDKNRYWGCTIRAVVD